MPVVAPYSPTDNGTGSGLALCNSSLSTSKVMQTATCAPFGHTLGISFLPNRAEPTARRISSSLDSVVIGLTAAVARWGREVLVPQLTKNPNRSAIISDKGLERR